MSKKWKRGVKIVAAIVVAQLLLDAGHALYICIAASRWEASIERDEKGVLKGCEAYSLLPKEKKAPDTAILMVHGINASPRHYDLLAPVLAEQGFACRVMRLPGFAEPLSEYAQSTSRTWVEAVAQELSTLRTAHQRVGVVAHSLGGAATIEALLARPELADFVVLLAPAVGVSNTRSPVLSTRTWHDISHLVLWFTQTVASPFGMDCRDPQRSDHPGRTPFTPRSILDNLFELMDRNRGRAGEFRTPLLMVLSATDRVVSAPQAEVFFRAIASEEKTLLMLKKSGHAIPLDLEWQEVASAITQLARPEPATETPSP